MPFNRKKNNPVQLFLGEVPLSALPTSIFVPFCLKTKGAFFEL